MTGGLSISGARVFTPGRNLGVATVRIEDGRIVAVGADNPKKDKIVVASAYVKRVLAKYGKLNVVTLEELAAACL